MTQVSLWCIVLVELSRLVISARRDIAYGGILNITEEVEDCSNSDDFRTAIRFAIKYGRKRWPHTVPTNDRGKIASDYDTQNCSILTLVYSHDGVEPSMFVMRHPTHPGRTIDSPLFWGVTYRFHVTWPDSSYWHRFVVTEYHERLFIYQHTFRPAVKIADLEDSRSGTPGPEFSIPIAVPLPGKSCHTFTWCDFFLPETLKQCPASGCEVDYKHTPIHNQYTPADRSGRHRESANTPAQKFGHLAQHVFRSGDGLVVDVAENLTADFRILTLNIWNTNTVNEDNMRADLYKQRIRHLAKLCQRTEAEVITMQEVRFEDGRGGSWGPNQVQHLAQLLPDYQFVYEPAQIQEHGIPRRIEEGLAVFSRYPIVDHTAVLLSRDMADIADTHQRMLLDVTVDVPVLGHVHVMTTHLSLSHVARQRSVVEIWSYLEQLAAPAFLTGDLNAEAHNDEVKFLSGSVTLHGVKTSGLHDLWLRHHGTRDRGFTFSTLEEELSKRIDLIFMKEHQSVICKGVDVIDDGLRKKNAASDHLGLLAAFRGTVVVPPS